jgi:hypothetical protein
MRLPLRPVLKKLACAPGVLDPALLLARAACARRSRWKSDRPGPARRGSDWRWMGAAEKTISTQGEKVPYASPNEVMVIGTIEGGGLFSV